jgi:hypothetical protein
MFTISQIIAISLAIYTVYYVYCGVQEGKAKREAEEKARRLRLAEEASKEASEKFANACCDLFVKALTNVPKK